MSSNCINMMTSSNGNIFRVTGPLRGEFTGNRWTPLAKASDAELWCILWSVLEQWLSKQSRRWWFETPSLSFLRHYNESPIFCMLCCILCHVILNISKLRQKWPPISRQHLPMHFREWKCTFFSNISLKFLPKGPIDNIPALVQIMAWRPPGDKPLSEPMMFTFLTHICINRPQWVNRLV